MLLKVTLQKQVLQTLVIDEKALVPDEDKQFVFVVKDGKAVKTEVNIGVRRPGKVQIVSGLATGDEVVTQGTLRIRNGSAVNVLSQEG
jgi:membrane fusion protein (multidrug efflux system)